MRGDPQHRNGTHTLAERAIDHEAALDDDSSYVRYRNPLTLAELTYERCKLAHDLLALDYRDFVNDLDTNEECPNSLTLVAMHAQNAIRLWEAATAAWRRGVR